MGCKYGAGGQVEWGPIRGAPHELSRDNSGVFSFLVSAKLGNVLVFYRVTVGSEVLGASGYRVYGEQLNWRNKEIYKRDRDLFEGFTDSRYNDILKLLRRDQVLLTQLHEIQPDEWITTYLEPVINAFANMRFLDLVPDRMRQPSFPGQIVLGDSGENLPTVLQALCADPAQKEVLTQWTRELTPMDVADFDFREDPSGRV